MNGSHNGSLDSWIISFFFENPKLGYILGSKIGIGVDGEISGTGNLGTVRSPHPRGEAARFLSVQASSGRSIFVLPRRCYHTSWLYKTLSPHPVPTSICTSIYVGIMASLLKLSLLASVAVSAASGDVHVSGALSNYRPSLIIPRLLLRAPMLQYVLMQLRLCHLVTRPTTTSSTQTATLPHRL